MISGVRVEIIDLKNSVRSAVVKNDDDGYTIVLNARMCYECLQEAYFHEMEHIKQLDFEKNNVDEIESYTHSIKNNR